MHFDHDRGIGVNIMLAEQNGNVKWEIHANNAPTTYPFRELVLHTALVRKHSQRMVPDVTPVVSVPACRAML